MVQLQQQPQRRRMTSSFSSCSLCYCWWVAWLASLLFLASSSSSSFAVAAEEAKNSEPDFIVGGYLPEYRIPNIKHPSEAAWLNATSLYLTDLYLFSTDFDPALLLDKSKSLDDIIDNMLNDHSTAAAGGAQKICCLDRQRHMVSVQHAQAFRREQTGTALRVWLTIGGADRSHGFGKLLELQQAQQRQKAENNINDDTEDDLFVLFGNLLVRLCQRFELTGIVLDDQHPQGLNSLVEIGTPRNMQKLVRVTQIIQCFQTVHQQFTRQGQQYQLALTMRPGVWLPSRLWQSVQYVHLMAYDMYAPNPKALELHVKPAVEAAVKQILDHPSSLPQQDRPKLLLGFPAFGRERKAPFQNVQTFGELYDSMSVQDLTSIPNEWNNFVLDSPNVVQQKVEYALQQQQQQSVVQGIFMWELGQDKKTNQGSGAGILLQTAAQAAGIVVDDNDNNNDSNNNKKDDEPTSSSTAKDEL
ncbi:hypothetical protein ACA910_010282 [Epithemia clementina (nom. ined.)]